MFIYSHSHSDCFPVSQTVPVPQTQTRLFSGSPDSNQTVFWFPRFEPACFPVPQTGTRLFSGSPDWNPSNHSLVFPRPQDARMQECKNARIQNARCLSPSTTSACNCPKIAKHFSLHKTLWHDLLSQQSGGKWCVPAPAGDAGGRGRVRQGQARRGWNSPEGEGELIEGEVHASHPISSGRRVQNHPRHLLLQQNFKVCPGLHCLQLMSDKNIKGDIASPLPMSTPPSNSHPKGPC